MIQGPPLDVTDMDELISGQRPSLNRVGALWRALSPTGNTGDAIFRVLLLAAAGLMIVIVGSMILLVLYRLLVRGRHGGGRRVLR